ncbi:unnamed protein product [Amoebophrya sp. A120]|nr:unnamed protein product [Amoebophrya sp. A120]|eukprot:GSA120T00012168001.1
MGRPNRVLALGPLLALPHQTTLAIQLDTPPTTVGGVAKVAATSASPAKKMKSGAAKTSKPTTVALAAVKKTDSTSASTTKGASKQLPIVAAPKKNLSLTLVGGRAAKKQKTTAVKKKAVDPTCKCVNWKDPDDDGTLTNVVKNSPNDPENAVAGGTQEWITPQKDDTEYGKVYVKKYKGAPNYGEYCAAWEDNTATTLGATDAGLINTATGVAPETTGKSGMHEDCEGTAATRPKWCMKKWCYVRLNGNAANTDPHQKDNGKIITKPLDSNAPGQPDGPNCATLSDVTISKYQDSYVWWSYQICDDVADPA